MGYKLTSGWPQDTVTGAFVNPDGAVYLTWLENNTPEPADPPTKAERIAGVLKNAAEGRDRTTVQLAILIGEMVLAPYAAQLYSVSLEIALMGIYARNKTYRLCKDAETAIEAIEDEP